MVIILCIFISCSKHFYHFLMDYFTMNHFNLNSAYNCPTYNIRDDIEIKINMLHKCLHICIYNIMMYVVAGSLKYVHQSCLQQWLTASETRSCELCKFNFIMHTKIKPFNEVHTIDFMLCFCYL